MQQVMKTVEEVKALAESLRDSDNVGLTLQEDFGWRHLGNGYFSDVYGHDDSDYVIKVCRSSNSDSWPFYAKFCLDNQDNPIVQDYLPKIHGFYRRSEDARHYVAVLDKLYPVSHGCMLWDTDKLCPLNWQEQLFDLWHCSKVFNKNFFSCEMLERLFPEIIEMTLNGEREYLWRKLELNRPIYTAGQYIVNALYDFCDIDVHAENIMQTASGRLVITDPVSFSRNGSSVEDVQL